MKRFLTIGGSDAAISAALRARETDPEMAVTMVMADRFPNFSICGLPFYVSDEVHDWRHLAHRTIEEIEREGIILMLDHPVEAIDPAHRAIRVKDPGGHSLSLEYDELLIATGAVSVRPDIPGIDLPGVFLLRWLEDSIALKDFLDDRKPASAVVIGGGYIGMEMADAFTRRGMDVTVIEFAETVMTTLDPELGLRVEEALRRNGVRVATHTPVSSIERSGERLLVRGRDGFSLEVDLVLAAAGAKPNAALAASAGVATGDSGAIRVNKKMETNAPHIFAAGDCAETRHRILQRNVYMPLGSTAHKQGRAAGENAAGGRCEFRGSLGTQVVKIFDLVAGRTGLRDKEAKAAGFDPVTIESEIWDHKVYYPGASRMIIRITGDRTTGKLLGAQILGRYGAEISKRVDVIAAALFNDMNMDEISSLDLSYTPPLSSPWDPVQIAAQEWLKRIF